MAQGMELMEAALEAGLLRHILMTSLAIFFVPVFFVAVVHISLGRQPV
jgi:hypothetical protein